MLCLVRPRDVFGSSVNCSTFMLMPKAFNITHLQPVHAFLRSSDNPNNFGALLARVLR